jgi:NAD(P)-dependent dehydrogenase (short-subunit alcohol dehydrogenase family)
MRDDGVRPRPANYLLGIPPFDHLQGQWNMPSETSPVWFITGCSTGFGRELARLVLARGWRAVVTARDKARVADLLRDTQDRALALNLDVTDAAQVTAAVRAAEARFGGIDVLVNNAGYGYQASVEEGEDVEIRAQFDANVFGLFAMTRAVLPGMRSRRKGHVINISSVAGFIGYPGSGYYAATKHAVEGWSDALTAECGPLGIKVTCIEPGPFRTDWAGRSLHQTPSRIADYAETVAARMKSTAQVSGNQPGDPMRAAEAIIHITESDNPPRHLVLGAFGVDAVTNKLKATLAEIEAWRETGLATDYPKG